MCLGLQYSGVPVGSIPVTHDGTLGCRPGRAQPPPDTACMELNQQPRVGDPPPPPRSFWWGHALSSPARQDFPEWSPRPGSFRGSLRDQPSPFTWSGRRGIRGGGTMASTPWGSAQRLRFGSDRPGHQNPARPLTTLMCGEDGVWVGCP